MRCHLSTGDGFGDAIAGPEWSDDSGWADYANYSTIRFGDIDGDGAQDVCARANSGIVCSRWTGDGFGPSFLGPALSDDSGWNVIRHYSTVRLVDVDGDGRDDLCARANAGMRCWPSTGDGFASEALVGPEWADAVGWGAPQYYETIRGTSPKRRCVVMESCNGVDDDCDGEVDEGCPTDDGGGSSGDDGTGGATSGDATSAGTDGSDSGGLPGGGAGDGIDSGCGCTSSGHQGRWAFFGILGVAFAMRRRRRTVRRA
jgi:MYXO-CTERM domain-containing protein